MTVEEQLAKAQSDLEAEKLKVKNQNSHITKIEQENKRLKNTPAPTKPAVKNSAFDEYNKAKWKKSVVADALATLVPRYTAQRVETMRVEVEEYCGKHMVDSNTTEAYVVSVFELLFGRAMGNPKHLIHRVQVAPVVPQPATTPPVTPARPLHETLTPPVMSPKDAPAVPGNVPPASPSEIKSVRDSFPSLKERIENAGKDSQ